MRPRTHPPIGIRLSDGRFTVGLARPRDGCARVAYDNGHRVALYCRFYGHRLALGAMLNRILQELGANLEGFIFVNQTLAKPDTDRFVPNPEWDRLHLAFHNALIGACGAATVLEICETMHHRATRFRNLSNTMAWRQREVGGEE